MPRQCRRTAPKAPKSTFINIGMIISQISTAIGRLTLAISAAPIASKAVGNRCPRPTPTTMQSATQSVR